MAIVLAPLAKVIEVPRIKGGVYYAATILVLVAALLVGSFVYIAADNHYLKARLVTQGATRVEEVEKAIALNPFNDMYRAELGLAHTDNVVTAITQYTSSGSTDPAQRAIAQAQFDKAEKALLDVIAFVPSEYDNYVFIVSLYSLGAEYLDSTYSEKAVEYGEKGVKVEPFGPAIRFQLSRALMSLGRYDEARGHMQTAVDLDPRYAEGWMLLGEIERAQGNLEAAQEAFSTALELKPGLTGVAETLAAIEASIAAEK